MEEIAETGYWVLTRVMLTSEIFPPVIVTDTVTSPRRLVPVPLYVPSRYAVTDGALAVEDADAAALSVAGTVVAVEAMPASAARVAAKPAQ